LIQVASRTPSPVCSSPVTASCVPQSPLCLKGLPTRLCRYVRRRASMYVLNYITQTKSPLAELCACFLSNAHHAFTCISHYNFRLKQFLFTRTATQCLPRTRPSLPGGIYGGRMRCVRVFEVDPRSRPRHHCSVDQSVQYPCRSCDEIRPPLPLDWIIFRSLAPSMIKFHIGTFPCPLDRAATQYLPSRVGRFRAPPLPSLHFGVHRCDNTLPN